MQKCFWRILAVGLACLVMGCEPLVDEDLDGLDDRWEAENASVGVAPGRKDMIVMPVLRPNLPAENVWTTLNKTQDFFAKIGVKISYQWGAVLGSGDLNTAYKSLRGKGIRSGWGGKVHGILIANGDWGGQTSHSDWSGVPNNWKVIVHELGHQLGLGHTPPNSPQSPFYTSLMNYDYSYGYNGDTEAIHFSNGQFASLQMNERALNEVLPFSADQLAFLTQAPYGFPVRAVSANQSHVDFNLNGVFGEGSVRADINYGYSVTTQDTFHATQSMGGIGLSTWRGALITLVQRFPGSINWKEWKQEGLSPSLRGILQYQTLIGSSLGSAQNLPSATDVTGDPFAAEALDKLWVTYPTAQGVTLKSYRADSQNRPVFEDSVDVASSERLQPWLVVATNPSTVYWLLWSPVSHTVEMRPVVPQTGGQFTLGQAQYLRMGDPDFGSPVESDSAIGAAWDSMRERIWLVHTARDAGTGWNGMLLTPFTRETARWRAGPTERVGGVFSFSGATRHRPAVVFQPLIQPGNREGDLFIYSLQTPDAAGGIHNLVMNHRIWREGKPAAWATRMMINEWTSSRNGPAAVALGDDIAWAWHLHEGFKDLENRVEVSRVASGTTEAGLTDFDDVTFILTRGLRESLEKVR